MSKLSDYPASVADELRKKGFEEIIRHPAAPPTPTTIRDKIGKGCTFVFLSILFVAAVAGILRAIYMGFELLFGWIARLFC